MTGLKKLAGAAVLVLLIPVLFIAAATGAVSGEEGSAPVPGVGCGAGTSGPTPAVQRFRAALFEEFPDLQSLGICSVRKTRGPYASGETWSQHAYCNAQDYTRPGAPATLDPVVRWIEENREAFAVNHLLTYPAGSGFEHVIHVDFHPERTGNPDGRTCQTGELDVRGRPVPAGPLGVRGTFTSPLRSWLRPSSRSRLTTTQLPNRADYLSRAAESRLEPIARLP